MRRIGLLGGTFDPVHVGHLALARAAVAALRLDRVVLLPSGRPWQKPGLRTSGEHRLAMVRLAIQGDARLSVDDLELRRDGRTYTIDTLVELRPWDALRVPGPTWRCFEAGSAGLAFIAVGAPPMGDPHAESEMRPGWWGG